MKHPSIVSLLAVATLIGVVPGMVGASGIQAEAAASEAPIEITWLARLESGHETSWAFDEIERRFNARIIPIGIDTNDGEKVGVMLASGEFPDVGSVFADRIQLHYEGVTRAIPKEMIRQFAPNYTRRLDEDYPLGWLAARNPDNHDEYLGLLGIRDNVDANVWFVSFRADWARNVGVDLPGYEESKIPLDRFGRVHVWDRDVPLDWLESLLTAFRDGDPDGNGENDTIPWGGFKYPNWTWLPIMGAYGFGYNHTLEVDGELTYYAIAPAYREFLKTAARWYAAGLVDTEFVNLDLGKGWDKVKNGQIGAETVLIWYTGNPWAMAYPPNTFASDEEVAAGAEVVAMPPPVGPGGHQGAAAYWPVGPVGANWISIGSQVDDGKLERILQILDWMRYGDEEGWVTAHAGKPGVHFDWEGEEWNSVPLLKNPEAVTGDLPAVGKFPSFYPIVYTMDRFVYTYPKHLADFYQTWLLADRGQSLTYRPVREDFANETNVQEINQQHGATMSTVRDEFYYSAIIGEIDIDTEWDAYVEKWLSNGGEQWLEEMRKAPLVSGLREGEFIH